ncbi:MAG: phosphatidylglycerophosphatase A [Pseudomonadota bacterium]
MTTSTERLRPSWRFLLGHPAHFVALGFGSGMVRLAPGTFGTLAAFPLYWYLSARFAGLDFLLLLAALFVAGIWACGKAGHALGVHDHGAIVWDEIVAFMLVLYFTPDGWRWQALAFLLFRLFDILKPPPIAYYDQHLPGGVGVMFDDLLAAGYALLCLALWKSYG